MSETTRILIVEDLPTDAELAEREARQVLPHSEFLRVETREDFLAALASFRPGLILSDFKLPQFDGLTALRLAQERAPDTPFIILTGSMNEDTAVECMKAGAWDYVIKEHVMRLGPAILSSLEQNRLRYESKLAELARSRLLQYQEQFNELYQALLAPGELEAKLKMITAGVVEILGVDFCRIWVIAPGDLCEHGCIHVSLNEGRDVCKFRARCLHLIASSGRYTHTDGAVHRRVPFGAFKIGRVASGQDHKFLTNDVANDPLVHNHAWARELTLVSFAGYQIRPPDGETLGVLALFSKRAITPEEETQLDTLSCTVARVIGAAQVEKALRESEARYRVLFEGTEQGILVADAQTQRFAYANQAVCRMLGYTTVELLRLGVADIHPQESLPRVQSEFEAQLRQEKTLAAGLPCLRKDGTVFLADINSSPILIDGRQFNVAFFTDVTERKRAEENLKETLRRLRQAMTSTIQVLDITVEARDPYTAGHQHRTTLLAEAIAGEMGLSPEKIEGLRMAGQIHDIGKISVPSEILSKPTRLISIEFELVKMHAQKGYEILKDVESSWPLAEIVYQHHERLDGSGYPRGLKGDEILMEARILAVADTVEAMASHRPYRPALGIEAALEEIDKNKGVQYDPDVAAACLKLFREKRFSFKD
jgi:PAS domain S-box-containing protein